MDKGIKFLLYLNALKDAVLLKPSPTLLLSVADVSRINATVVKRTFTRLIMRAGTTKI